MLSGIYIFPLACTPPENSDTGHWADGIQATLISSGVQNCEPTDSLRAGRLWPADGGELAQQAYLQEGNSTDPADSRSQDWGMAVADFDQDGHLDLYRSHLTAGICTLAMEPANFDWPSMDRFPSHPRINAPGVSEPSQQTSMGMETWI